MKKMCQRFSDCDFKKLFCFGEGFVRVMGFVSMVLLVLYSLVFQNFVIIFVILLQALALMGTFMN
ncbi:MAG: hypothetical protein U0M15_08625 [Bacillota bacterium]|nr:hypothetical protein [Bacillota bacterium]